jgi:DNA-binding transcriptional MerR regulator
MSKISEVSKRTGLSKRTLQYYDDEGLLHVPRSPDNYRMYDGETMEEQIELITSIQKQHMFPKMPEDGVKGTYVELASRLRKKENRED